MTDSRSPLGVATEAINDALDECNTIASVDVGPMAQAVFDRLTAAGFLVVRDDATLRERIARVLAKRNRAEDWEYFGPQADAVLGELRREDTK